MGMESLQCVIDTRSQYVDPTIASWQLNCSTTAMFLLYLMLPLHVRCWHQSMCIRQSSDLSLCLHL